MANTIATAIGQEQLYNSQVLKGFVETLAPFRAFVTDVSPAPAEKGYTVNVSYIPSGSAPYQVVDGTGYNSFNSTREAKSVSLDKHYAVGAALSDREISNSSIVRIEDTAYNDGARLATYVFQDVVGAISASSFPLGHNVNSSSLFTLDTLIDVRKKASQNYWPTTNRNVILNVNPFTALLKDDDMKYIYSGDTQSVKGQSITDKAGFRNIWEVNGFPSNMVSGSNIVMGLAVVPDAMIFANRFLAPAPEAAAAGVTVEALTDPTTGLTIGSRKWYDPTTGQVRRVYECLWGKAVANNKGAISITCTVDA